MHLSVDECSLLLLEELLVLVFLDGDFVSLNKEVVFVYVLLSCREDSLDFVQIRHLLNPSIVPLVLAGSI